MTQLNHNKGRIPIGTQDYSDRLRSALIDPTDQSIQLTDFSASSQVQDLSVAPNFGGFGRLHHFRREVAPGWPANPLPIDPACQALGLGDRDTLAAQVFQSAGCNWRCWYCYVPFEDLTARRGSLMSVAQMCDWVIGLERPLLVDLTGGQPDLTPEWPVWMLEGLDRAGVQDVYVWSDDNLSTDYMWRYLTRDKIDYLGNHPRYGRACCVKGFDATSFQFNTKASPKDYELQFSLLDRLQSETTIDYYLYATFTTPSPDGLDGAMARFVDRLQAISETLPLRTVPLKIVEWGPVADRLDETRRKSLSYQQDAVDRWLAELEIRFTAEERGRTITEIPR